MWRSTRTRKISVTVDAAVLAQVRKCLRSTKKTLSAHVSDALAEDLRRRALRELLDEFEGEHCALTAAELEAARLKVERALRRRRGSGQAA